uniref:EF-hand domain-containing protein n=1 Tax=Fibrocapsa japonica TaxID=94617 RepID=A0A7S2UUC3_9STRA|eukprot:CAMPEP_0113942890 /NCGR_PEP_ID=MMETSP1339-20121228/14475_1 /TAXON_ID=94617 /ORGANISM="Fibrocapsa japonica" /LENGTH=218 /DNA_ID=CAMNT_0000947569 /DNA_START=90 /DNA_END=746 /DNA_ORIENTATION=+ /assembly_acc=CAM_ASM_000762
MFLSKFAEARTTWGRTLSAHHNQVARSVFSAKRGSGRWLLAAAAGSAAGTAKSQGEGDDGEEKGFSVESAKTAVLGALDGLFQEARSTQERMSAGESPGDILSDKVSKFAAAGGGQITWGFATGACSGYFMKKATKAAAVGVGGVFCLVQGLSYGGYIDVNYKKLEKDMTDFVDLNHDGKIDKEDFNQIYDKVMSVLSYNMPAGSGFAAGVAMGFKMG